jgi:Putative MetA-pathway of phenol degradation
MTLRIERILACAAAAQLAIVATAASAEDYLQAGIGIDYSTGDYGDTQDTEIVAVPVSLKYNTGAFYLRASLPYVHVKGPGSVIPGDGGAVPGATSGALRTSDGIGDLTLGAGYAIDIDERTWVDISGRLKLPTANEAKGLGTGTTDVTAETALNRQFGAVSLSARGGRRFNGTTAALPLRDVWLAGAGAYYQTGDLTLGLDYDWRQASLAGASERSELTGSATYKFSSRMRLQGYGYTGFSKGSPDIGAGLQLLYRFGL